MKHHVTEPGLANQAQLLDSFAQEGRISETNSLGNERKGQVSECRPGHLWNRVQAPESLKLKMAIKIIHFEVRRQMIIWACVKTHSLVLFAMEKTPPKEYNIKRLCDKSHLVISSQVRGSQNKPTSKVP